MTAMKKMLVVVDSAGRIVAAAHPVTESSAKMSTGLLPLPGQEIHEIEIPEEITRLKSGHQFHMALSHAKFNRATKELEFPEIIHKRLDH